MATTTRKADNTMWTYKGVDVFRADRNASGIRWYARVGTGIALRADTKASMRELINDHQSARRRAP
jgi:hypothetical protein